MRGNLPALIFRSDSIGDHSVVADSFGREFKKYQGPQLWSLIVLFAQVPLADVQAWQSNRLVKLHMQFQHIAPIGTNSTSLCLSVSL